MSAARDALALPAAARTPADPAPTLHRILREEARHGFSDAVVRGGLDAFLRTALKTAPSQSALFAVVAQLPREGYGALSPSQRSAWAQAALARLSQPAPADRQPRVASQETAPRAAAPAAAPSTGTRDEPRPDHPRHDVAPPRTPSAWTHRLDAPVSVLGRLRDPTIEKLRRVGVDTVRDMLWYFPNRHVDFTQVKPIAALMAGEEATVVGQVRTSRVALLGKRMRATEAVIEDASGKIRALWFNQPYLAKSLQPGMRVGIAGRVGAYRGRLQFDAPEWQRLDGEEEAGAHVGRLVPVYPLTQGLPGRTVRRLAYAAIERYLALVPESLPGWLLGETGFPREQTAIRQLHFPDTMAERNAARARLAFQELLAIQIAVLRRKREQRARRDAPSIVIQGDFLQRFVDALPFQLTGAQMRALTEIRHDLAREEPMARLLQGDVGSGKTVVAAAAMLGAVAAGHQAVLMAPTEILAEQHDRTFNAIFGGDPQGTVFYNYTVAPALGRPVRMALLTGSATAARKREVHAHLERGTLDIVVGTHALIEEGVAFRSLGLAVVDEQHRFGVMQRDALRGKGGSPHLLVMTATPIPRTLALTVYGDLDSSRLDELPPGRQPVETHYVPPEDRADVYAHVRREIAAGRQAFVICPLVEESDAVEAKAAVQEFDRLRTQVFADLAGRMRLLHGRMTPAEKDTAMADVRSGAAAILVSTAVVEVGVDVPNASLIVIEGADRFGLAQLHQFRGRVGRGNAKSYCYLLSEADSPTSAQRLSLMEKTSDGFELAEADLRLRGPGEYFGTRQSGLPDLRVASLTDHDLLLKARNYAERILDLDPHLRAPEHQPLARRASGLHVEGAGAVH